MNVMTPIRIQTALSVALTCATLTTTASAENLTRQGLAENYALMEISDRLCGTSGFQIDRVQNVIRIAANHMGWSMSDIRSRGRTLAQDGLRALRQDPQGMRNRAQSLGVCTTVWNLVRGSR
jgi:hypothetical protein